MPGGSVISVAYRISADAHPDVLARIATILNIANRVPWSVSLRESAPEEVLTEAVLREIPAALADMIRRKLLQLTCVIDVEMELWPQKRRSDRECCS